MPAKKAAKKSGKPKAKPVTEPSKPEDRPTPQVDPEPAPVEASEPKAEQRPSAFPVAMARAFDPSRSGYGKTVGAVALVLANAAFFFAVDQGLVPGDGMLAVFAAQVFGLLTGGAIRHLGTRWKATE